jgi:elongation factor P--(R)-beta-lysine ligase
MDFQPTASWDALRLRAELLTRLRTFFATRDFLEVETPLLSADTVIDRHLDPIPVTMPSDGRTMWLQTSPEFAMKRLLASGAERIYQVTHAFRAAEVGEHHNPEFTMIEWYRVGDSMATGMKLLGELACELLEVDRISQISYAEAFQQFVGIDPHSATVFELERAAASHNMAVPDNMPSEDRDEWLNLLLATLVEPQLGSERPEILFDYPASQAALAQVRDDSPPVAERFELYVNGIELANGYHELLDAATLRERNEQTNRQRVADGKTALPEESRLLSAMEHGLPNCVGVALGFDRLVMIAAGASKLSDVMAFPIDRS